MVPDVLLPLAEEGWISGLVFRVRSGKEADVYLCRGTSRSEPLVAAKHYRPTTQRSFGDDSTYWEGRLRGVHRRHRVAMEKRSRFGRELRFGAWVSREREVLEQLTAAGARVPHPIAQVGDVLLMGWVGDENDGAPQLRQVRLAAHSVESAFETLLGQVELFLSCDLVHGDLSECNVLWWEGEPWVIDVPQAVDVRFNRAARELLQRDVANLCRHFGRYGLLREPSALTHDLWSRWLTARI